MVGIGVRFELVGAKIGKLVEAKQAAYGDSFGKVGEAFRQLYPDGIRPEQYDDALCLVRIWDKMMRIATDKDAFGESPYRDIAGYALLGLDRHERLKKATGGSRRRGRPRKNATASAAAEIDATRPRRRGRPRKNATASGEHKNGESVSGAASRRVARKVAAAASTDTGEAS